MVIVGHQEPQDALYQSLVGAATGEGSPSVQLLGDALAPALLCMRCTAATALPEGWSRQTPSTCGMSQWCRPSPPRSSPSGEYRTALYPGIT